MSNIRHLIRGGADGTESEGEVQRCSRGGGSSEELCYRAKGWGDTISGSPKPKYANTLQKLEKGEEMGFPLEPRASQVAQW